MGVIREFPGYLKTLIDIKNNARYQYCKTESTESFVVFTILYGVVNCELTEISKKRRNKIAPSSDYLLSNILQLANEGRAQMQKYDLTQNPLYLERWNGTFRALNVLIQVHKEKHKPVKKTYSEVLKGY